jgi:peptidoglycan/LPS O-acetylase OafA/YrhL
MIENQKKIFFENLDGLRFFCFLSVFFYHSFTTSFDYILNNPAYHFIKKDIFGNGNLGVNFFFVLSGFLITYLLIEEKRMNSTIDLKKFWMRRILRIWPLYFFCVFFGFVLFPLIKTYFGQTSTETAHPISYLFFVSNFDLLSNGLPDASVLGVLWSIAVEEQFYFIWPIILSVFPVKRYWIPFLGIMIVHFVFRATYNTEMMHEYHSLSCMGDLTIGALGAWLIHMSAKFKQGIENASRWMIGLLYMAFIAMFFFRDEMIYYLPFTKVFERSFIAIIILFIILEQTYSKASWIKMSKLRIFSNLGRITYGLYCLHFIAILIVISITRKLHMNTEFWQVMILETVLALGTSILISMVSYRFFEKPFLKLKNRFAYIIK